MQTTGLTHARIAIPADCLPLLVDLIGRLGGNVTDYALEGSPASPMPEMERGGKMLRALRLRAGMTQKSVASALGLPQSHVSAFESNRRTIPYKHAQKLAGLLNGIPGHFMTPNAATIAAMNGAGEDGRQIYDSLGAMYKDLDI
ncbi:MAG: helix-turn-helix domain-containing protein [Deltaproteobacteria bacterium]|jgi:DNA-binding XRE family transcriptional regulator|nr:helix-turn-helix domain-containing protein [Deltaproteobacteria bacterium]